MNKEIGSEFWLSPQHIDMSGELPDIPCKGDTRFYLSGRTALYAIIEDIKASRHCKKAYLPSYCCDSMVEPFLRHDLEVSFYDVTFNHGIVCHINPEQSCDIILTVDYFGFANTAVPLPKAVHIHDITHSFLSAASYPNADYYFGSLRKWGPVGAAGFACKKDSFFLTSCPDKTNEEFIRLRSRGYSLKNSYIEHGEGNKQDYLELFGQAEELLDSDYINYRADAASLYRASGIKESLEQRRKNARILINGLKESRIVDSIYPSLNPDDVPLFVPVIVKNGLRNELRKYLIDHQVYCPVHWPIHSGCNNELYFCELSLICDQRYTETDMQHQLNLIIQFEERYGVK